MHRLMSVSGAGFTDKPGALPYFIRLSAGLMSTHQILW